MKRIFTLGLGLIAVLSMSAQFPCQDGLADGTFPCHLIDMHRFLSIDELGGGTRTNDIWGWVNSNGREYALVGKDVGTAFVDVTNPVAPVYIGELPTATVSNNWRDIKVYNEYAFIVSEADGHGMQVFDLSQLVGAGSAVTFEANTTYNGFGSAHNIAINEETGYAYGVGTDMNSGGLHVIDVSNPLEPVFVGAFEEDGYTHDAQIVIYNGPDMDYQGKEICFASNEDNVAIIDVEDKSDMQLISHATYENPGYTHQSWLTEDHKYMLVDDEGDEIQTGMNTRTYIFDVQDLDNPIHIGTFISEEPNTDHNQYVRGNFVYQSNYRSGLRVLDISNIENADIYEVAYFDVIPDDENSSSSGSWSNYCYFPSETLVVTDIGNGLFILGPNWFNVEPNQLNVLCADTGSFDIQIDAAINGTFTVDIDGLGEDVVASTLEFEAPGGTTVSLNGLSSLDVGVAHFFDFVMSTEFGEYRVPGTIVIDALEPMVPENLTPFDGQSEALPDPVFSWNGDANAIQYVFELFADEALTVLEYQETTMETLLSLPFSLLPGTYYWQVKALSNCGETEYSPAFSFTIETPDNITSFTQSALVIYPNPGEGVFAVDNGLEWFDAVVYDISGRRIWEGRIQSGTTFINLSEIADGSYFLHSAHGAAQLVISR